MSKLAAIYGTTTELVDDWRERAACRQYDPEWWFAYEKDSVSQATARRALDICRTLCPVRQECLEFAEREPERYGIWGGLTDVERNNARAAKRQVKPRVEREGRCASRVVRGHSRSYICSLDEGHDGPHWTRGSGKWEEAS